MIVPEDGLVRDTENTRFPPSSTEASPITRSGATSSSTMVPVPVSEVEPAVPVALVAESVRVSSSSSIVSSVVATVNVADVSPGRNVTVPVAEV